MEKSTRITLKSEILRFLYKYPQTYYRNEFEKIKEENNKYFTRSVLHCGIIYKGVKYPEALDDFIQSYEAKTALYHKLDKSLYQKMDKYIEDTKSVRQEVKIVKRFLTILMNTSRTCQELSYLLGSIIYGDISHIAELVLDKKFLTPEREKELDVFKIKNQSYFDLLNMRIVDNSLMSAVYNKGN